MRRVAVVALALAACVPVRLATSAPTARPGFAYGVAAGEVTPTSALLWTRVPAAGKLSVYVWPARDGSFFPRISSATARPDDDLTVRIPVRGLRPGTRYRYQFGRRRDVSRLPDPGGSPVGTFVTAPAPTANVAVRFAYSGDADATPGPDGAPGFNRFEVYGRMAAERNDFDVNLGDTIYSDSELSGSSPALSVEQKWQKYRLGLALPALRRLRAGAGLYSQWDDHEFVNDFSRPEDGEALYRAGVEAFRDYTPVTYTARDGLYRTFRWGRNLQLFLLDERSFRSAKASAGHACDVAGSPDVAPTLPPTVRAAFSTLVSRLAQPVPQACLDAIGSPARTMLGARQHAAFVRAISASTATWKVVLSETPIQQLYALPYDRWEGYAAERTQLLRDLAGVKNVVFLTTDAHANLVGEVRLRTLEPPGPLGAGIREVVTGPVATNTWAREVDAALGVRGLGQAVTSLFLKPPPPRGIGLRCAATDVDSYAEVRVTASTLTVTPKDASGRPVREASGAPCAPLVLHAAQ